MKTNRQPVSEVYADVLGTPPDPNLLHAVELLDQNLAVVTRKQAPPQVLAAIQRLAESPPPGARSRSVRSSRPVFRKWLPHRLSPIFAILLVVVLAAATYHTVPILDRAFYVDAGTRQIVSQDLGMRLNLSQTEAGYTVTLQRAYADANRIVVAYTIQGPANQPFDAIDRLAFLRSTLADANGAALDPLGGGDVVEGGSVLDNFDASSIPGEPKDLNLRLTVPLLQALQEAGQEVPGAIAPFTFRFTVPFHPGRVATPNETVTAGGAAVTLERVVVSPTETRLYLRGLDGTGILPDLTVDGWDSGTAPLVGWQPGHAAEVSGGVWQTKDGLLACDFGSPLMEKQGGWTLVVRPGAATADGRQVSGGPWVFHFTVPGSRSR